MINNDRELLIFQETYWIKLPGCVDSSVTPGGAVASSLQSFNFARLTAAFVNVVEAKVAVTDAHIQSVHISTKAVLAVSVCTI